MKKKLEKDKKKDSTKAEKKVKSEMKRTKTATADVKDTKCSATGIPNEPKAIIHDKSSEISKDMEPKPDESQLTEGQTISADVRMKEDAEGDDSKKSNEKLIAEKTKVHEVREKDASDNTDAVDSEASISLLELESVEESKPNEHHSFPAAEEPFITDQERYLEEIQNDEGDLTNTDIQDRSKEGEKDIEGEYDLRVKELKKNTEVEIKKLRKEESEKIKSIQNKSTELELETVTETRKLHYTFTVSSAIESQKSFLKALEQHIMASAVEKPHKGVVHLRSTSHATVTVLLQSLKPNKCSSLMVTLESQCCKCYDFHIYIR